MRKIGFMFLFISGCAAPPPEVNHLEPAKRQATPYELKQEECLGIASAATKNKYETYSQCIAEDMDIWLQTQGLSSTEAQALVMSFIVSGQKADRGEISIQQAQLEYLEKYNMYMEKVNLKNQARNEAEQRQRAEAWGAIGGAIQNMGPKSTTNCTKTITGATCQTY